MPMRKKSLTGITTEHEPVTEDVSEAESLPESTTKAARRGNGPEKDRVRGSSGNASPVIQEDNGAKEEVYPGPRKLQTVQSNSKSSVYNKSLNEIAPDHESFTPDDIEAEAIPEFTTKAAADRHVHRPKVIEGGHVTKEAISSDNDSERTSRGNGPKNDAENKDQSTIILIEQQTTNAPRVNMWKNNSSSDQGSIEVHLEAKPDDRSKPSGQAFSDGESDVKSSSTQISTYDYFVNTLEEAQPEKNDGHIERVSSGTIPDVDDSNTPSSTEDPYAGILSKSDPIVSSKHTNTASNLPESRNSVIQSSSEDPFADLNF